MVDLSSIGDQHHINVARDDLAKHLLQRACVFRERPAVNGHGKDLCATLAQGLQEFRIRRAVFLHSDTEALDGTVSVELRDNFDPCMWFRYGKSRCDPKGLERSDRLRAASDDCCLLDSSQN